MAVWKQIEGFPNYSVSDEGQVRNSKTARILKPRPTNCGYFQVRLFADGAKQLFYIHRLVALAFIPNPENKPEVNHKDGNKANCHVSNLEWNTKSENCLHRWRVIKSYPADFGKARMKAVTCIELSKTFESVSDAAKFVNKSTKSVSSALRGRTRTCAGFHWEYTQTS